MNVSLHGSPFSASTLGGEERPNRTTQCKSARWRTRRESFDAAPLPYSRREDGQHGCAVPYVMPVVRGKRRAFVERRGSGIVLCAPRQGIERAPSTPRVKGTVPAPNGQSEAVSADPAGLSTPMTWVPFPFEGHA